MNILKKAGRLNKFQPQVDRSQSGLASIIVVSVLVILITLVAVGFAVVMNRASHNALNNQLSTAATYAAESGINDAINYLQSNPGTQSTTCNSLSNQDPFKSDSNLSGNGVTKYSCVLINSTPNDLLFQNVASGTSEVVKGVTSTPGDQFMFSWSLSGKTGSQPASSTGALPDQTAWNANNYTPLLRVSLYPIANDGQGGLLTNTENVSKTFFLFPTSAGGNVTSINYNTTDGSLIPINCGAVLNQTGFTTDSYDCHLDINGLAAPISNLDYYYIRLTPIYSPADIRVQVRNTNGQADKFLNAQTAIDVTGKSGNTVKRLDARIGSTNAYSSPLVPDYGLRSANAICKRLKVYDLNRGPVNIDSAYCHLSLPCPATDTTDCPQPAVTLTAQYPSVTFGGTDTLHWSSNPYTASCSAPWTSSTSISGSQGVGPLYQTTKYTITCTGIYGGTATDSTTVTVVPGVKLTANPNPIDYGGTTTLSWVAGGVTSCSGSGGSDGTSNPNTWPGSKSIPTGSQQQSPQHNATYTITCNTTSGGTVSDSVTVKVGLYVVFHQGSVHQTYECAYQYLNSGTGGVNAPFPYDYYWCPSEGKSYCSKTDPCTKAKPFNGGWCLGVNNCSGTTNTDWYYYQNQYYQIENNFDLGTHWTTGYPAYCPNATDNSQCVKAQLSTNCADGAHSYNVCGEGYYQVFGGSGYATCSSADNWYTNTNSATGNSYWYTPFYSAPGVTHNTLDTGLVGGWGGGGLGFNNKASKTSNHLALSITRGSGITSSKSTTHYTTNIHLAVLSSSSSSGGSSGGGTPTTSISANPTSITSGQSTTVSWSSTNAAYCSLNFSGSTATSGSATLYPTSSTTYSANCFDSTGTYSAIATVYVSVSGSSSTSSGGSTSTSSGGTGGGQQNLPPGSYRSLTSPPSSFTVSCSDQSGQSVSATTAPSSTAYVYEYLPTSSYGL